MAKATTKKPEDAKEPGPAPTAAQLAEQEAQARQQAAADQVTESTGTSQEAKEKAAELAKDQQADVAAGGTGIVDVPPGTPVHSIMDPKNVPVDYAAQTLRRPPQRTLPPEAMEADAMPRGPLVNLPYGSEPRTVDPRTGLAPVPEAKGDVSGESDADVTAGREATNQPTPIP